MSGVGTARTYLWCPRRHTSVPALFMLNTLCHNIASYDFTSLRHCQTTCREWGFYFKKYNVG